MRFESGKRESSVERQVPARSGCLGRKQLMDADTLVLRPSPLKWLFLLGGSLTLLVASLFDWYAPGGTDRVLGWMGAALFGVGMAMATGTLLPNSSSLRLAPEGFVIRILFRFIPIIQPESGVNGVMARMRGRLRASSGCILVLVSQSYLFGSFGSNGRSHVFLPNRAPDKSSLRGFTPDSG